jgi:HD-like signal output (HDOD) protein
MIDRQRLLARIKELPTFSPTVVRLTQLAQNPEAGAEEYEAVVALDPALTTNVLQMANSE